MSPSWLAMTTPSPLGLKRQEVTPVSLWSHSSLIWPLRLNHTYNRYHDDIRQSLPRGGGNTDLYGRADIGRDNQCTVGGKVTRLDAILMSSEQLNKFLWILPDLIKGEKKFLSFTIFFRGVGGCVFKGKLRPPCKYYPRMKWPGGSQPRWWHSVWYCCYDHQTSQGHSR